MVIKEGIVEGLNLHFEESYICPICLQQFSRASLDSTTNNYLTLEDVPPSSLGGRSDILTCLECNGRCGTQCDHHLTEGLRQYDHHRLVPNSKFPVTIDFGMHKVQGEVNVSPEGVPTMLHKPKRNPPGKLDSYIGEVSANSLIKYKFRTNKEVDERMFSLALLKVGYLLTFKIYGYTFLFDRVYDSIRKQLQNPELEIWPTDLWCHPPGATLIPTASFVVEKDAKVILPFFSLKTEHSINHFGAFIPLPANDIISSVRKLRARRGSFSTEMWAPPEGIDPLREVSFIKNQIDFILKCK